MYYFEEERKYDLIKLFKTENFKVFSLTKSSFLNTILQAGISALKTHYCYNDKYKRSDVCAICAENMNEVIFLYKNPLTYI